MNYEVTAYYRVNKSGVAGNETFYYCTIGKEPIDYIYRISCEMDKFCKNTGKTLTGVSIHKTDKKFINCAIIDRVKGTRL